MSTIRQRLGNVIAWVGLAALICGVLPLTVLTAGSIWEAEIQTQPSITVGECSLFSSDADQERKETLSNLVRMGFEPERCNLDYESNLPGPHKRAFERALISGQAFALVMWDDQPYFFYDSKEVLESKYSNPHHNIKRWLSDRKIGYSYRRFHIHSDWYAVLVIMTGLWIFILVINYIFYGSARVLPWKPLRGDG